MRRNMNIELHRSFSRNGIAVLFSEGVPAGEEPARIAAPLQFVPHVRGDAIEPTLTLSADDSQQLMDELWRVGVRPTEGTGSAGALAAVKYHLEDMRRLALTRHGVATLEEAIGGVR